MTYKPLNADEAKQQENENKPKPYEAGIYDFEVYHAEDQTSKAGNSMIKLSIKVFGNDGMYRFVNDYLVHSEKMEYKFRYAADACGVLPKYDSGKIVAADFTDRTGKAKVGVEVGKPKDDGSGENYPDKNIIKEYIKRQSDLTKGLVKQAAPASNVELDDDIPFAWLAPFILPVLAFAGVA